MNKCNKYAVAYISFFDNELQLKIVEAEGWKDALNKVFANRGHYLPSDYKEAQAEAFNGNWMFNVIEVIE